MIILLKNEIFKLAISYLSSDTTIREVYDIFLERSLRVTLSEVFPAVTPRVCSSHQTRARRER